VGPLLGGAVYAKAGYYAVFAMCFGLIGLDILLRLATIEKKIAAKWTEASDSGLSDITFSVEEGKQRHNKLSPNSGEGKVQDPFARLSKHYEVQQPPPHVKYDRDLESHNGFPRRKLPPILTLLQSPRILASLWGCLVQATLMAAFDTILPLRVHQVFHWDSLGGGLVFLPVVIPSFAAPIVGSLCDKYGPRYFATAGFILACPLFVCLRFVTHDSIGQKTLLCTILFLLGVANLVGFPALMAEITFGLMDIERRNPGIFGEQGAYAQAYALFNIAFAGGCLLGPIWGGFLIAKAGWGTLTWSVSLLSAITALPTVLWVGGWICQTRKR
jgi:Major Facilitator Superfamily